MFIRPILISLALTTPALSQTCTDPATGTAVDTAAVAAAKANLSGYSDVLSDISCDAPTNPAHKLLCETSDLWEMEVLATWSWVYATENATGQETDHANPPRAEDYIARRDACTDATCLCDAMIAHTNEAMGGMSPYAQ